ncbi:reverse transcriptase domain-containing protein, partial [Thiolapillus sp.]|uniref:reverse transcriptase domain-containing protein n=1 Tax=Thiolapillus sp. TaxID=2017437 RepID=UPI003AF486FB
MRALQGKLAPILVSHYKPRNPVHGFLKGRSIVTNAKQHKRKRYVLNIDLKNFYESINFGRVIGLFKAKPFNMGKKAAAVAAHMCIFENSLPQGAATSPVISNYIASELDRRLSCLARRYKVPRRFKWNSSKNLCQYSAKYWHEEKTWTATRYCYWDWG